MTVLSSAKLSEMLY